MSTERKCRWDTDQNESKMTLQKHWFAAVDVAAVLAGFAGIPVVQAQYADATYKAELPPLNS